MLWENQDPDVVLRERFGFRDARTLTSWVTQLLADEYNLSARHYNRVALSADNALVWVDTDCGSCIVKICIKTRHFDLLSALSELTHWLDAQGRPVSPRSRAELANVNCESKIENRSICNV